MCLGLRLGDPGPDFNQSGPGFTAMGMTWNDLHHLSSVFFQVSQTPALTRGSGLSASDCGWVESLDVLVLTPGGWRNPDERAMGLRELKAPVI